MNIYQVKEKLRKGYNYCIIVEKYKSKEIQNFLFDNDFKWNSKIGKRNTDKDIIYLDDTEDNYIYLHYDIMKGYFLLHGRIIYLGYDLLRYSDLTKDNLINDLFDNLINNF